MGFLITVIGIVLGVIIVEEIKKPQSGPVTPTSQTSPPPPTPTPQPGPLAPLTTTVPGANPPSDSPGWATPLSDYEVQFQKSLSDAGGTQHMPYRAIFIQSHLETGGGTSRALKEWHNGFGFHGDVGAPNQFWDGTHQTTTEGEVMRVYKSLDLSIGDYLRLIQAHYPACVAAAQVGDIKGYFAGLVQGGYATDPNYYNDLLARYKAIYGVDA